MRCLSPKTVGFLADGKTLTWSSKKHSKEFATFQLPCSKCIECRLEYARQWAVRCVHEASMHPNNCFITLTYAELKSEKLQYRDFQTFLKRLRKKYPNTEISYFATGEYGEQTKRPHWHALIFGWEPPDKNHKYTNDRGDRVHSSAILDELWGHGITELGTVTFESAGYCARYAAKKLVHGSDNEHDYNPISKKSAKPAIGKRWLEKNWPDAFNTGKITLLNGDTCSIPRYYEKWLKKEKPDEWKNYISNLKLENCQKAEKKQEKEKKQWLHEMNERPAGRRWNYLKRSTARLTILNQKLKSLTTRLK